MAACVPFWEPFELRYHTPGMKRLPAIGMGTYLIRNDELVTYAVNAALMEGYRSFDTAAVYCNEKSIGKCINTFMRKHDLSRDDFYITSKLANNDYTNKQQIRDAYEMTCLNLGFEPDLYLIHYPGTFAQSDERSRSSRFTAWSSMLELHDAGRVGAIGVSNFGIAHLKEIMEAFHGEVPAVNQVEYHPMYHDEALHEFCIRNDIVLQGYSTLGGTGNDSLILNNKKVISIAEKHSVNPAQVLLTWSLQKGVPVIPKSVNPRHLRANINLNFKLTDREMRSLDRLGDIPVITYGSECAY